jgi:hypothetical protein
MCWQSESVTCHESIVLCESPTQVGVVDMQRIALQVSGCHTPSDPSTHMTHIRIHRIPTRNLLSMLRCGKLPHVQREQLHRPILHRREESHLLALQAARPHPRRDCGALDGLDAHRTAATINALAAAAALVDGARVVVDIDVQSHGSRLFRSGPGASSHLSRHARRQGQVCAVRVRGRGAVRVRGRE